ATSESIPVVALMRKADTVMGETCVTYAKPAIDLLLGMLLLGGGVTGEEPLPLPLTGGAAVEDPSPAPPPPPHAVSARRREHAISPNLLLTILILLGWRLCGDAELEQASNGH